MASKITSTIKKVGGAKATHTSYLGVDSPEAKRFKGSQDWIICIVLNAKGLIRSGKGNLRRRWCCTESNSTIGVLIDKLPRRDRKEANVRRSLRYTIHNLVCESAAALRRQPNSARNSFSQAACLTSTWFFMQVAYNLASLAHFDKSTG